MNTAQRSNSAVQSSQLSSTGQYKKCVQYDIKFILQLERNQQNQCIVLWSIFKHTHPYVFKINKILNQGSFISRHADLQAITRFVLFQFSSIKYMLYKDTLSYLCAYKICRMKVNFVLLKHVKRIFYSLLFTKSIYFENIFKKIASSDFYSFISLLRTSSINHYFQCIFYEYKGLS